jgi:hypothetical protein
MNNYRFQIYIILAIAIFAVLYPGSKSGQCASYYGSKWKNIETRHTILLYQSKASLHMFDQKILFSTQIASQLINSQSNDQSASKDNKLGAKVDSLFKRVQQILDMRKKMPKVKVKIYPDKASLHQAFLLIYRKNTKLRAWYLFEKNTVYVSVDDLHEGILAHELGHAIIDHFFAVRPPSATAEILARYVDKHLKK